jgi:hypothetical protein
VDVLCALVDQLVDVSLGSQSDQHSPREPAVTGCLDGVARAPQGSPEAMPPEQLSPLTDREQRVVAVLRVVFPADVVLLAVAVLFGTIAHGLVSAYCNAPGGGPQSGTAASYCSTVSHGWSWGVFIAASVAIVVLLRLLGSQWRHRRQITLAVLVVALVANTVIVSSLPGYLGP